MFFRAEKRSSSFTITQRSVHSMDTSYVEGKPVKLGWFDRVIQHIFGTIPLHTLTKEMGAARVSDVLTYYGRSLRKFLGLAIFVLLSATIAAILELIVPIYYKEFFDTLANASAREEVKIVLLKIVALIFGVHLAIWTLRRGFLFGMIRLARDMMIDLRTEAFGYLLAHSRSFFGSNFTGSLVQKVGRYQRSYDRIADSIVFNVIPTVILVFGSLVVIYQHNTTFAQVAAVWIVLVITCNYVFSSWKLKYDEFRAAADSKLSGTTADILSNHQTVEAHRSHMREVERHASHTKTQMHAAAFTWSAWWLFHTFQELSVYVIQFFCFFIGVYFWVEGSFTLGTFVLLQSYVFALTDRVWNFGQVIRDIYESIADAKEMVYLLERPHDIKEADHAISLPRVCGNIEFRDVSFSYENKAVLKHISHVIRPGERVGIVGPSGAGKSTLIKLLPRFMDVSGGAILVDGHDVRSLSHECLGAAMSIVPQDPDLFHRTLMENIRYGKPSATDSEVIEAARNAHCHEFISALPHGYNTLVGERGVKLSGGERQRVAIARAFLRNAPILILDESTASLDSESEHHIQESLARLLEGRTTIVIAHRLSTIRHLDRIIVIDAGEIVEIGTHDALMQQSGTYAHLWNLQQHGFVQNKNLMTA